MVNTSERIIVESNGNASFFMLATIRRVMGSSPFGDDVLFDKIYSKYIFQYSSLLVQWVIGITKSIYSNKIGSLSSTTKQNCLEVYNIRMYKIYQPYSTIQNLQQI